MNNYAKISIFPIIMSLIGVVVAIVTNKGNPYSVFEIVNSMIFLFIVFFISAKIGYNVGVKNEAEDDLK